MKLKSLYYSISRGIKEIFPRSMRDYIKSNFLIKKNMEGMLEKLFMVQEDIDMVDKVLEFFKPKVCLEWGSGGSTIYFPQKHSFIEKWISIEENPNWHKEVLKKKPDKVDLKLWRGEDYVSGILKEGMNFDFILIDGIKREECMRTASFLLKDKGICLLHDTWRKKYQPYFFSFKYYRKLTEGSAEKENGLYIFTNENKEKIDLI